MVLDHSYLTTSQRPLWGWWWTLGWMSFVTTKQLPCMSIHSYIRVCSSINILYIYIYIYIIYIYIYIYIYQFMLLPRIFLTLSHHSFLSSIAPGKSSRLHPVSAPSCCRYVQASRSTLARPCHGVHRSISVMNIYIYIYLQKKLLRLKLKVGKIQRRYRIYPIHWKIYLYESYVFVRVHSCIHEYTYSLNTYSYI